MLRAFGGWDAKKTTVGMILIIIVIIVVIVKEESRFVTNDDYLTLPYLTLTLPYLAYLRYWTLLGKMKESVSTPLCQSTNFVEKIGLLDGVLRKRLVLLTFTHAPRLHGWISAVIITYVVFIC